MSFSKIIKVAVVQDSPVLFNLELTLEKCIDLIHKASKSLPDLIVFPESFIPGYPRHMIFGSRIGSRTQKGRELWQQYYDNSVSASGKEVEKLCEISKKVKSYLSIGITEKENKSLYCSQLLISPVNGLIGKHRKIKPTAAERIIWGEGSGKDLITHKIENSILGTLICWENYMPLARMAMYNKGVNIYIAPTADNRDNWQNTLKHIALEGRCFVIGANQYVPDNEAIHINEEIDLAQNGNNSIPAGGSCIISPLGEYLSEPVWDRKDIIFAELNLDLVTQSALDFDAAGHYSRPDIFKFDVNDQPETILE